LQQNWRLTVFLSIGIRKIQGSLQQEKRIPQLSIAEPIPEYVIKIGNAFDAVDEFFGKHLWKPAGSLTILLGGEKNLFAGSPGIPDVTVAESEAMGGSLRMDAVADYGWYLMTQYVLGRYFFRGKIKTTADSATEQAALMKARVEFRLALMAVENVMVYWTGLWRANFARENNPDLWRISQDPLKYLQERNTQGQDAAQEKEQPDLEGGRLHRPGTQ